MLQANALTRENRNLAQEIKDMADQIGEGGRSQTEMQKALRRVETEKEEIQVNFISLT